MNMPEELSITEDWKIFLIKTLFGGNYATVAIAGALMAYSAYLISIPLTQIPASINLMTTQMQKLETAFISNGSILSSIDNRLTDIEKNTQLKEG